MHTRDGRVLETMWANIRLQDGAAIGIGLDITAQQENAQEQIELQTQLTYAVQIANLGHWEYDVSEDRFRFNDQFYRIFGTTAREVGGYTMSSSEYTQRFVHPEDRYVVGEEIQGRLPRQPLISKAGLSIASCMPTDRSAIFPCSSLCKRTPPATPLKSTASTRT